MSTITELNVDECLSLLEQRQVGRIGLQTESGLQILPVNYVLQGETVVFRTLPYGVIANNADGAEVAFEVDTIYDDLRQGWSVLARGTAHRIADPGEVRMIREEGGPEPWADGHRSLYFRIEWTDLTGRQVGIADRPAVTR
jgi:nitroimidazol reductase NimA-like FMN-containing flavoprotein (pyridoxamine 5'-phosphate oxidase superfamily)